MEYNVMVQKPNLLPPFLAKASAHLLFRPPTAITKSNHFNAIKTEKKTRQRERMFIVTASCYKISNATAFKKCTIFNRRE
ncbi:hypothetical protein Hanom_Chr09g00821321 [Helianthus anomalus]